VYDHNVHGFAERRKLRASMYGRPQLGFADYYYRALAHENRYHSPQAHDREIDRELFYDSITRRHEKSTHVLSLHNPHIYFSTHLLFSCTVIRGGYVTISIFSCAIISWVGKTYSRYSSLRITFFFRRYHEVVLYSHPGYVCCKQCGGCRVTGFTAAGSIHVFVGIKTKAWP
jgi:hypothetical protein